MSNYHYYVLYLSYHVVIYIYRIMCNYHYLRKKKTFSPSYSLGLDYASVKDSKNLVCLHTCQL